MKASDLVIKILTENSVNRAWYVQGGAISHVIDSAYQREISQKDFKTIFVQHEQAAGFAADAYSRSCEKVGAVMVTSGPGATNVMTSIASSWYDGVPVIYLTGQVRTWEMSKGGQRQRGFQETDVVAMSNDITKYSVTVTDIRFLRYEVEKAIYFATNGRPGPVLIDLPMNIQWAEVDEAHLVKFEPPKSVYDPFNLRKKSKVSEIHSLITRAEKPVILVGGGIRSRQTIERIISYAETHDVAVVTSFAGKHHFDDTWSLNFGIIGTMGMHTANEILHTCDVMLVVGSRLSWRQIRANPDDFAKLSKIIHVDVDQFELNQSIECHITLNLDAEILFEDLNKKASLGSERKGFIAQCAKLKSKYSYMHNVDTLSPKLHPHVAISEISRLAEQNSVFCLDTGQNLIWAIQGLQSNAKRLFLSSWGHSPMGYAICAALGAAEAYPEREIVCITGDGGIQMNIQELQTIVLNKYNIKIIVINNNSLGAIKEFQDDNLDSRHVGTGASVNYRSPDFRRISDAYGLTSSRASNATDLSFELEKIFKSEGPALLDIEVDEKTKMVLSLEAYN